jgi:hypothetical protein
MGCKGAEGFFYMKMELDSAYSLCGVKVRNEAEGSRREGENGDGE